MSTEMTQITGDVSVIICAYTEKRWDDLIAAIESVKQQTLLPKEIIVVIDYNPCLLMKVQEHVSDVICIENKQAKGASGSRNSGVAIAQGAVVAFLDDDAIAEPNWIEQLLAPYEDPNVSGVGGKIDPNWHGKRPFWFPDEFYWVIGCTYRGMPTKEAPVRNLIGANMSVRRQAFEAIQGFRESFGNNKSQTTTEGKSKWLQHRAGDEETDLCMRITQNLPNTVWLYTPAAAIKHCVSVQRMQLSYFLWRCYDEGLGKAMLVGMHGSQIGLSSERTYTFKVLPQGITHYLSNALLQHDGTSLARLAAILAGLTMTITGYTVATVFSKAPKPSKIFADKTHLGQRSTFSDQTKLYSGTER